MRASLSVKLAAMNTIAANSAGMTSNESKYRTYRTAENPALRAVSMKLGRSQNEMVEGEAKLSWICEGVSVVAKL